MRFGGDAVQAPLDDVLLLGVQDLLEEVEAVASELITNKEVEATARMARTLSTLLSLSTPRERNG
jgi:hypothetical protein